MNEVAVSVDEELGKFYILLAKELGSPQKQPLRVTSKGIFIPEQFVPTVVEHFQRWLKSETGAAALLPTERCFRRLFGSETPDLFYLLEGKGCLAGFMSLIGKNTLPWPRYNGSPIDGRGFLHPKDPALQSLHGLEVISGAQGTDFIIQHGDRRLHLSQEFTSLLFEKINHSLRLRRTRHLYSGPLRDTIKSLPSLLKRGRFVDPKRLRLIPNSCRRRNDARVMILGDLVLIFDKAYNAKIVYGLKGKNIFSFVHQEFSEIKQGVRSGRIGKLDLRHAEPRTIGSVQTRFDRFSVDMSLVLELIQQTILPAARGNIATTLFEYLITIGEEIARSDWILERDISLRQRGRKGEYSAFLSSPNWIFRLQKKTLIKSCQRKPRVKAAPLVLKPLQRSNSDNQQKTESETNPPE